MADEPITDDAATDPETGRVSISPEALRNLREAANRKAAPTESPVDVAKVQRENALLRAGVDLDHPNAKYLLGDPDLDTADKAAVQAAATQLGILGAPTAPPEEPPADPRETAVRTSLQSDTVTPGSEPARPSSIVGVERGREVLKQGGGYEDAIGAFVATVREGAANGDRSAIIAGDAEPGQPVGDRQARLGYSHIREVVR